MKKFESTPEPVLFSLKRWSKQTYRAVTIPNWPNWQYKPHTFFETFFFLLQRVEIFNKVKNNTQKLLVETSNFLKENNETEHRNNEAI